MFNYLGGIETFIFSFFVYVIIVSIESLQISGISVQFNFVCVDWNSNISVCRFGSMQPLRYFSHWDQVSAYCWRSPVTTNSTIMSTSKSFHNNVYK